MSHSTYMLAFASMLAIASSANAEPVTLSDIQMDEVSAGAIVIDPPIISLPKLKTDVFMPGSTSQYYEQEYQLVPGREYSLQLF